MQQFGPRYTRDEGVNIRNPLPRYETQPVLRRAHRAKRAHNGRAQFRGPRPWVTLELPSGQPLLRLCSTSQLLRPAAERNGGVKSRAFAINKRSARP